MDFPSAWPKEAAEAIRGHQVQANASAALKPAVAAVPSRGANGRADLSQMSSRVATTTARRMSLHGNAGRVADIEIEKGFSNLFRAVRIWIGSIDRDPDIFHVALRQNTATLTKVILGREVPPGGIGDGNSVEWVEWLDKHRTRVFIVLSFIIWDFLERRIFSHQYPIGVTQETAETFDEVVQVLKAERYARGEKLALPANKWRSDTILTLTKTPSFQRRREQTLRSLCDELHKSLSRFMIHVDYENLSEHLSDLEALVIQPAAKLHQAMRCSRHEYVIRAPDVQPGEPLRKKGRAEWTLMDIGTWDFMGVSEEVVGVFACMYPTIVRRGFEGESDVEVVKAVVLAYDGTAPGPPQRLRKVVSRRKSQGHLR